MTYTAPVNRRRKEGRAWTPNQVVAHNIARARLLRGWTQEQAATEVAPYLGTKLSTASFSAIERSVDGGRIRQFDADEIFAFARGFGLPIGWFVTPPPPADDIGVATPDSGPDGLDAHELLDAILGTPATLEEWQQVLMIWPAMSHRTRLHKDGSIEDLGREPDVHQRAGDLAKVRAQVAVREALGDIGEARLVLERLTALLDQLDEPVPEQPNELTRADTKKPRRRSKD